MHFPTSSGGTIIQFYKVLERLNTLPIVIQQISGKAGMWIHKLSPKSMSLMQHSEWQPKMNSDFPNKILDKSELW